jgi:hypothetical protein
MPDSSRLVLVMVMLVPPGKVLLLLVFIPLLEIAMIVVVFVFPLLVIDNLTMVPGMVIVVFGIVHAVVVRASGSQNRRDQR